MCRRSLCHVPQGFTSLAKPHTAWLDGCAWQRAPSHLQWEVRNGKRLALIEAESILASGLQLTECGMGAGCYFEQSDAQHDAIVVVAKYAMVDS